MELRYKGWSKVVNNEETYIAITRGERKREGRKGQNQCTVLRIAGSGNEHINVMFCFGIVFNTNRMP